jgi:putative membrane protein
VRDHRIETQPERTGLAWQRTGLGVAAVSAIVAHGGLLTGDPGLLVVGGAVALLGLAVLGAIAPYRYRRLLRAEDADASAAVPRLAAFALGVVLAAGAAATYAILTS